MVPSHLNIDEERVKTLKEAMYTPDRTQTFVGLLRVLDEEGEQVGPLEAWVNLELFQVC